MSKAFFVWILTGLFFVTGSQSLMAMNAADCEEANVAAGVPSDGDELLLDFYQWRSTLKEAVKIGDSGLVASLCERYKKHYFFSELSDEFLADLFYDAFLAGNREILFALLWCHSCGRGPHKNYDFVGDCRIGYNGYFNVEDLGLRKAVRKRALRILSGAQDLYSKSIVILDEFVKERWPKYFDWLCKLEDLPVFKWNAPYEHKCSCSFLDYVGNYAIDRVCELLGCYVYGDKLVRAEGPLSLFCGPEKRPPSSHYFRFLFKDRIFSPPSCEYTNRSWNGKKWRMADAVFAKTFKYERATPESMPELEWYSVEGKNYFLDGFRLWRCDCKQSTPLDPDGWGYRLICRDSTLTW